MKFFSKANGKRGEIFIYDAIGSGFFDGGISAKSFSESMKSLGNVSTLDIYMNSPGGSVFEGIAIHNQIKRFAGKKVVHIDGIAASIASVIAMAGDEILIAANGTIMIHDPYGMTMGTAEEMRKQAEALDKIRDTLLDTYVAKTGGDRKQISQWMSDETWMNADESVSRGFATKKTEEKAVKASFAMLEKFAKVPDRLKADAVSLDAKFARMQMRASQLNRGASPAKP